jgi:putative ABC transport system substrate-binding protein
MRRRVFVILLGGAAAWPLAVLAQPRGRIPVIGYLIPANPEPVFGYFKEGLQKLGYVEGRNIHIEFRSAEGKSERLAGLAAELVRLNVDILVAAQTPAITAAKQATSQIPIVMAGAGDPVGTGLIASLARPGGNITGTSSTTAEVGGKLLELFREVLPSAKRVAVLVNATDPFGKPFLEQLQTAARTIKLEISPTMIRETSELSAAFPDMVKRRTDVVIVQPSLPRKTAAELSLKHRLPAVAPSGAFPDEGGLMSYSATVSDVHRETAVYVDKILKGAKPADLPVQQPTKFELVVNLKTAKALGITIPRTILLRADRVIE